MTRDRPEDPQAAFYDERYYAPEEQRRRAAREQYLQPFVDQWLAALELRPDSRYLDLSCGDLQMLASAVAVTPRVCGLDVSLAALAAGRGRHGPVAAVQGDAQRVPFADDSFDRVSCMGSLEHYPDASAALREVRRVAAPGGRVLFTVPNARWPFLRFWPDPQPLRTIHDLDGWRELLAEHGFGVISEFADNHSLTRPYEGSPSRFLARRIFHLITIAMGLRRSWQFGFVCE
jgi:SAM-dependent methyltransferase